MDICSLHRGSVPMLVSMPHDGSLIPADLAQRMVESARRAPDTDWHVSRLYNFALELGASMLVPRYSRYVVDLNRPPDDTSLYPGQNTTGLCPIVQFSAEPVYRSGCEPGTAEIAARVEQYWQPYHRALDEELARLRSLHGRVVLWEAHSIRSVVPFLFDGRLPDLNLGTAGGASCSPGLQARLLAAADTQRNYSCVLNGRFKGGYITRHYGNPKGGIEAVQLELAQCNYMDEDTFSFDEPRATSLRVVLRDLLQASLAG